MILAPLIASCYYGDLKITQLLLNHPTMTKECINDNTTDYDTKSPFYHACEKHHYQIIKLLLNDERVDVNLKNQKKDIHPLCAILTPGASLTESDTNINDEDDIKFRKIAALLVNTDKKRFDFQTVLKFCNKNDWTKSDLFRLGYKPGQGRVTRWTQILSTMIQEKLDQGKSVDNKI